MTQKDKEFEEEFSLIDNFIVKDEITGYNIFKKEIEDKIKNIIDGTKIKVIVSDGRFPISVIHSEGILENKEKDNLLNLTARYLNLLEKLQKLKEKEK